MSRGHLTYGWKILSAAYLRKLVVDLRKEDSSEMYVR
jgi:hypothetical protein